MTPADLQFPERESAPVEDPAIVTDKKHVWVIVGNDGRRTREPFQKRQYRFGGVRWRMSRAKA